jgi:hypothetical protein
VQATERHQMHAIEATVPLSADEAETALRAALAEEGFGVLTEIDVAATLEAKLGVDRPALKILGAGNPTFAHEALQRTHRWRGSCPATSCSNQMPAAARGSAPSTPRELLPDPAFAERARAAAARRTAALAASRPSLRPVVAPSTNGRS